MLTKEIKILLWVFGALFVIWIFSKIKKAQQFTPVPVNSEGWSPTPVAQRLHDAMSGINITDSTNDAALNSLVSLSDAQFIAVCNEFKRLYEASVYSWVADEYWISSDVRKSFNERAERLNVTI